ncbi:hypothetical protein [Salininema proteolyticum]|uniref:Lipoprotein n=1 Tax=Salininema proteolyticum TaxID=1607685 RepID=A0ABV8TUC8_9ACTN
MTRLRTAVSVLLLGLLAACADTSPSQSGAQEEEDDRRHSRQREDPAASACRYLLDEKMLNLGADSWVGRRETLDQWSQTMADLADFASGSEAESVAPAAGAVVDFVRAGEGTVDAFELHRLSHGLWTACQRDGFVPADVVALPFPSDVELTAYSEGLNRVEGEGITPDAWLVIGLDVCQRIVDEHNSSGEVPTVAWVLDQVDDVGRDHGIASLDAASAAGGAMGSLCSDYGVILEGDSGGMTASSPR